MKSSLLPSAPLFGLALLFSGCCSTTPSEKMPPKGIAPGHEQCVQNYIERARALKEERGGDPYSIEDAYDAKIYAKTLSSMHYIYAWPLKLTEAQRKEATEIDIGLWVSKKIFSDYEHIHCRDY